MAGLFLQKLSLKKSAKFLKSNPKESSCFYGFSPSCPSRRLIHVTSSRFKQNGKQKENKMEDDSCLEKCPKKQREVKHALSAVQNRYLQPRNPILTGHKFTMSPPTVEPYVNVYIEEACRIREECRKLREGGINKKA